VRHGWRLLRLQHLLAITRKPRRLSKIACFTRIFGKIEKKSPQYSVGFPFDHRQFHVAIANCKIGKHAPSQTVLQPSCIIDEWMHFYNRERPHSATGKATPEEAYRSTNEFKKAA
jgi:hypothetical protein